MGALSNLPNIGAVMEKNLNAINIFTPEELADMGSREALLKIRAEVDPGSCLSSFYALEGAIRGIRWHDLPEETKMEMKEFFNSLS